MSLFETLLAERRILLADGATGTNFFAMGLEAGEAPDVWNVEAPEKVLALHRAFVEAGSDIILTNTFGANRHRLKLHGLEDRVVDLNEQAARLARAEAEAAGRPVVVAGSVGPTGELFEPLGSLSYDGAVDAFAEQIEGLAAGGVDIVWIETMSAPEEMRAAAAAATRCGMPYTLTASFDTAGRTMMGLAPAALDTLAETLEPHPAAFGANCGVGASDLLVSVLAMTEADPQAIVIAKANCGVPHFEGENIVYSGTPELMADYVRLAADSGARIIGGCCGTSPEHVAAMRVALDEYLTNEGADRPRPDQDSIVARIGPLVSPPKEAGEPRTRTRRRRS
ncbi:MAG: methionine synthase I [Hyphomicrobiales bacterium]|nr:MAG: methionine synthase I [Hyphomicrobiales bacterium]